MRPIPVLLLLVAVASAAFWAGSRAAASKSVVLSPKPTGDFLFDDQPNTKDPNWKPLGKDVGLRVVGDGFNKRGILYVRMDGTWRRVTMDHPEDDVTRIVPAK